MAHAHEAAFLEVVDRFLDEAQSGQIIEPENLETVLDSVLGARFPDADPAHLAVLKPDAMRYVVATMQTAGLMGNMPGLTLDQTFEETQRTRPVRVFTGVIAAVIYIDIEDTLRAAEHFVLPLATVTALETLIQDTFGTSRDAVSVCAFPFQPADFEPLGVEQILTSNFAAGAMGDHSENFDMPFRQSLLRRTPPGRVWKMPDGKLAMPVFIPVSVMSLLAPHYWEHGNDDELEVAERFGQLIAEGLAARELLGCEVAVYCGHLHIATGLDRIVDEITTDLTAKGAVLRRMPHRNEGKMGRNVPCPCGSGVKYKKCCAIS